MWGKLPNCATCHRDRKGGEQHARHPRGARPRAWPPFQTRIGSRHLHAFFSEILLVPPREGPDCH
jgi:hypothetical protein